VLRAQNRGSTLPAPREFPTILPDRQAHDWSLVYDPNGAGGNGQVVVTLDGKSKTFDFRPGDKTAGTTFDRFGIVTSWIDGNSQDVYFDDVTYAAAQK
jgi:hypothetical protein